MLLKILNIAEHTNHNIFLFVFNNKKKFSPEKRNYWYKVLAKRKEKIPHTGDKASLEWCG